MEPLLKPALMRNILALRSLPALSKRSHSQSSASSAESRIAKNKTRGGQKRFASTKDAPAAPEQSAANPAHLPLFLRSFENPLRTAVCGLEEDVQHGEALRRSLNLARAISDELKVSAAEPSPPVAVAFITTNTPFDLVTLWAIWLSGNTAVPLGAKDAEVEDAVRDARCKLIVAADASTADQIGKSLSAKVLIYDEVKLSQAPRFTENSVDDLRHCIADHYYADNQEALLLYSKGARSPFLFRHSDLNSQVDRVITAWRMNVKTSVLHALPTREPFGLISSMLAPIAAGGRVVMLKQFDSIKVWAHILGIMVNHPQPLPKVDLYPATPAHFTKLLDRYQQLFTESKVKDFVKLRCGQRIAGMISDGQVSSELRSRWHGATGHNVIPSISDDACGGTVLSGDFDLAKSKKYDDKSALLLPLSGVQTRLTRHRSGGFGQLQVRVSVADEWRNVGDKTRAVKKGYELIAEEGADECDEKKKAEKD